VEILPQATQRRPRARARARSGGYYGLATIRSIPVLAGVLTHSLFGMHRRNNCHIAVCPHPRPRTADGKDVAGPGRGHKTPDNVSRFRVRALTKGGAPRPLSAIMRSGSSGRTAVSGKHCVDVARVQVPVGRATSALLATHPRRDAHDPRRESTDSGRPGHWCSSPSRGPIPLRGLAGRGCARRGLARRCRARRCPSLSCNAEHALNAHEAR